MSARFLPAASGLAGRIATAAVLIALCLAVSASAATADLSISLSDSPDPVTPGSNITYSNTLTNDGPDSASSLTFFTSIPQYTTFNASSLIPPAGWTCITPANNGTGTITCTATSLSSGSTATFSFTVKVSSSAPAGYLITNAANVSSSTPDWYTANNSATTTTAVTTSGVADVKASVSVPATAVVGSTVTFTQTITNNGGASATNTSLTESIPANTTFASVGVPAGWTCVTPAPSGTGTISCTLSSSLSSGSSASFPLTLNVNSGTSGGTSITETLSVGGVNDPNPANNSASATTVAVASSSTDFAVTTTMGPSRVADSGTLRFTNVVTNHGPASGNVSFSESIPSNTTFGALTTPAGWSCTTPSSGGTGSISCSTSSTMASGASSTFSGSLTVGSAVASGTSITLTGSVTASSTDSVSTNNSASATSVVDPSADADVSISIADSPDPVVVNQYLTYLITVTNNGPATASNVKFSDVLPAAVTYQSADRSSNVSCSFSSSTTTFSCTVSSLTAGETETIFLYVKAASSGTATNSVTITASDQTDALSSNNSASTSTTIDSDVDLTITKSNDTGGSAVNGAAWTWTIHVANGGSASATFSSGQRIVLDNLPRTGITYGSVSIANKTSITGTIAASISFSNDLEATASGGSVTIGSGGSFDLLFTATASTAGTYANPRTNGIAIVDPDGDLAESDEANNTATDSVTSVAGPDLTLTKSNDVSSSVVLPNGWTWTLHVANGGVAAASFTSGQTILLDNLPSSGLTYGAPGVANSTGITGTVSCSISSNNLTCTASGSVTIAAAGSLDVQFTATPSTTGTFANPRSAGTAKVDPNNVVEESNESNNTATDSVTVTAPDLTASITNNVSGATTLGNSWTWTVTLANGGNAAASFTAGQTIFSANLPNTNINYGAISAGTIANVTNGANVSCSIDGSRNLTCVANGATVTLGASTGSYSFSFTATPTTTGTFSVPRSGGSASIDPSSIVTESNEANNSATDSVAVTAPDLTATIANDVAGATTLGNSWTWTVTLANSGSAAATFTDGQTIFSDNLPTANVSYGSIVPGRSTNVANLANISCGISSGNLTCVASGGSVTFGSGTGSYDFSFTAIPSTVGTFTNPRSGGSASIDPSSFVAESNEANNGATDSVTVTAPDLTATIANDVAGATTLGNSWTWTVTLANSGSAAATFTDGQTIFSDNLPNANISYGSIVPGRSTNVTNLANMSCGITSGNVTCVASGGSVTFGSGTGSYDFTFTATPSAAATFTNPRGGGSASIDPSNVVAESDESNNSAADSVIVSAPDLTLATSNDVSGSVVLPTGWTWTLHVANGGNTSASFASGQTILLDNLPSSGLTYGTPSIANATGVTGTVSCSISSSDLTCSAAGAVAIATSGSFDVRVTVTPSASGTFSNPRSGGTAKVDPNSVVSESSESNNTATDSVTVTAPDLTAALTNDVGGATTLGNDWTWTIAVANSGTAAASFSSGQTILSDSLPNANVSYGTPAITGINGITGTIACGIAAANLTCTASGAVTMASSASFNVAVTATRAATGTFVNPRSGGSASVDPSGVISESNEGNNSFADTVTVTAPDLTAVIANDVSGATTLGNSWNWTVTLANSGNAAASFTAGQTIFNGNLPNANVAYGGISAGAITNVTNSGNVSCSIDGSSNLTCVANGATVTFGASTGSYGFSFTATPTAIGAFSVPRSGGSASIDPSGVITESNEANNGASDSVTVTAPDLTASITNSVGGSTTLGSLWNWSVTVSNGGNAPATFAAGQTIFSASLPNSGISYGAIAIGTITNVTNSGNIACAISSGNLVCSASGAAVTFGSATASYSFRFAATPSTIGTFAIPRAGGSASADPGGVVAESNESNNSASDNVTVTAPDLTLTVSDDAGGSTILGGSWTWTLHVANGGNAAASFASGQTIVSDDVPSANIGYGSVSTGNASGVTGTINCGIAASTLTCTASGAVMIAAGGSLDVRFTATPSAGGTFSNPRSGGSAAVDPSSAVTESNEANNSATDSVSVTGPDLSATSSNDTAGTSLLGSSWSWTIHVANSGSAANFANGQRIVSDNLPNASVAYGSAAVVNASGLTGTISCAISGTSDLTCTAAGAVTLAASSSFDVVFTASPSSIGTFANPRSGGSASVDPDGVVIETNEANNAFSDSVTVTAPDLSATIGDSTAGAMTLGNSFTWSLTVTNSGNGPATFASGQTILFDNLPSSGIAYASPSFAALSGISGTGTIVCSIVSTDLTCLASGGTVILAATSGAFRVDIPATPSVTGTFTNPRSGGSYAVDPANVVAESNESNNSASDSVTVTAPQLTMTMSDSVANATTLGQSWSWTLHIANSGNAPASFANGQAIVLDQLPNANITYGAVSVANASSVTGTMAASLSASNLTVTANGSVVIAAGGGFDLVFTATPSTIGTFANPRSGGTAAVDPNNVVVESNESDNTASDTVNVTAPDLTLSISNDVSGSIILGNSWTWTLHVANAGNALASFASAQTILSDALPAATYGAPSIANAAGVTGSMACSIDVANNLTCTASGASSIAAGGSLDVRVTVTPAASGTLTNPRSAGGASVDPLSAIVESNETNNSALDSVTVRAGADLSLALTGPAAVIPGDRSGFDYTFTVTNHGPQTNSGGFTITDVLPSALTFSAAGSTAGCTASGQTVTCATTSGLTVNGSQAFTVHVIAAPTARGYATNTGSVVTNGTTDSNGSNDGSNSVTTALQPVTDFSLSMNAPASANAGTQITYTMTVTNTGPSDDTSGFTLTDTLPPGTTFLAAASDAACISGSIVTCSASGLPAGASRAFAIVVAISPSAADGSSLQNRAAIASNGGTDPNASNDGTTATTTVGAEADLTVSLSGPAAAGAGSSIAYTLTVTNAGPADAQGVTVTAALPAGMTLVSENLQSGTPLALSNNGSTMTATASSFAAAASSVIRIFAVTGGAAGTFPISAAVSATTTDPAVGNNTAAMTTTVVVTAPAISGIAPLSGPAAGGQSVAISGVNLDSASSVTFGGLPATITANTSNSITAVTPRHSAGPVDIIVTTAAGSAIATAAYTYVAPPSIASVSPASAAEAGGIAVTIRGANFGSGATVTFGGIAAAVTSSSLASIVVTAPPHAAGSVDVTVANTDGQSATATAAFTYIAPPRVMSVSPMAGPPAGGSVVTIDGSAFMNGAAVSFGATPSTNVIFISATKLTATTPSHPKGAVDVTVSNPDGQSTIAPAAFTFTLSGDVNGDGVVSAADVFSLISYLFAHGAAPVGNADVNGDGAVSAADVFCLVNYLFAGGPAPR